MKLCVKYLIFMSSFMLSMPVWAVSQAEDIATTIMLRGYACGGKQVSQITTQQGEQGQQQIRATCPNGVRYQIDVSADGRVRVQPLQ